MRTILIIFATIPLDARATATTLRLFPLAASRFQPLHVESRERPAEVEDRAIAGHWEGDLIGGTKNSHIATLLERHSRFTALVKVRSKDTAAVVAGLSRQIRRLPTSLRRSLTWDRGLEKARDKSFTVATNVKVYFCDPHSALAARNERKH